MLQLQETNLSLVQPRVPLRGSCDACFAAFLMLSYLEPCPTWQSGAWPTHWGWAHQRPCQ